MNIITWLKNLFSVDLDKFVKDWTNSNPIKKDKILSVLNVFETGTKDGDYSNVTRYYDGNNGSRQITYGRSQTTEQGNLKYLIKKYIDAKGRYSTNFKQYDGRIGLVSLVNDSNFLVLLKKAGDDPVMQRVQDEFFDEHYWNPALDWASKYGFTDNLSILVIYDSFIHSGGILTFLRRRFPAKTPKDGGDQREWIKQYVDARHSWLSNHSNTILRKTVYRTNTFKKLINKGDWNLDGEINANGVKIS